MRPEDVFEGRTAIFRKLMRPITTVIWGTPTVKHRVESWNGVGFRHAFVVVDLYHLTSIRYADGSSSRRPRRDRNVWVTDAGIYWHGNVAGRTRGGYCRFAAFYRRRRTMATARSACQQSSLSDVCPWPFWGSCSLLLRAILFLSIHCANSSAMRSSLPGQRVEWFTQWARPVLRDGQRGV